MIVKFLEKNIKKVNKIIRPAMFAALPLETVTLKPMASLLDSLFDALLAIVAGLAILFLIVGGIRYIGASGDTEQMEKAKKMITHIILGLVIILVSYSTVLTLDNVINDGSGGAISITSASVAPLSGPVGTVFTIQANIIAVAGVDATTTIAHIQSPDETDIATIILSPVGGDVYSGTWTSTATGPYFVDINACDISANCKERENI